MAPELGRATAVAPGLYYTGDAYDRNAPLLVTANYLLTVLLVVRRVRAFNARLLVIDTDGINVWCSAGKGLFCGETILHQVGRYGSELLDSAGQLTLILPKLSLSGVSLVELRQAAVKPVIGPIYARELPRYLAAERQEDCREARIHFDLLSRLFTWLPGLLQALGQCLWLVLLLVTAHLVWGTALPLAAVVGLTAVIATLYPLLFPWLPGRQFAVKGFWLGVLVCAGVLLYCTRSNAALGMTLTALLFALATGVFFGLAYTGNSAVSSYTRVRKETARYLPVYVLLYAACLAAFVVTEFLA